MWTWLRQQQQRGAQFPSRERDGRAPGEAPAEAVEGRAAQQHDEADQDAGGGGTLPPGGDYPASELAHRDGDITPSAPEPRVEWDAIVQPERQERQAGRARGAPGDDLPLPEGK
ncbi:MAG TPA: hypothetical protein VEB68_08450 [Croceibacterium sp.]|nr:hypothetical protein [Croceibacterium sp.]